MKFVFDIYALRGRRWLANRCRQLLRQNGNLDRENARLNIALERLASCEAFDIATAGISKELKMRMEYADAETSGKGEQK